MKVFASVAVAALVAAACSEPVQPNVRSLARQPLSRFSPTSDGPSTSSSIAIDGGMFLTNLGTLGGGQGIALDVSETGRIVGHAFMSNGIDEAFLWSPDTREMTDLGSLSGRGSMATAINELGVVVGSSFTVANAEHAVRWDPASGAIEDLGTLGGASSTAWAVNASGQIAGASDISGMFVEHAFSWDQSSRRMRDLGTLGGLWSRAYAMNDAGQIAGESDVAVGSSTFHAALWAPSGAITDLGTLGGTSSGTRGINARGDVVGWSSTAAGAKHAVLWPSASHAAVDLGTLGGSESMAQDINERGQVVGWSYTSSGATHGFLWDQATGTMRDLGTLGGSASEANAINSAAHVVIAGASSQYKSMKTAMWASDLAPTANAGGPYTGDESSTIIFDPSLSTDADGDELYFRWNLGDGHSSSRRTPAHRYANDGTYTVVLTVTDAYGGSATSTAAVTIANAPPTAKLFAPSSVYEGSAYTASIAGSDPGALDRTQLEYALDCGEGNGYGEWSASVLSRDCAPQPDQLVEPLVVRGRVRDPDGAITEVTRQLTVKNAAPVLNFGATSSTTLAAGGTLSVEGSFSDAGISDGPWNGKIVWGDGTSSKPVTATTQGVPIVATHVYSSAGTWYPYLRFTDKDGKTGYSAKLTITVNQ